MKKNHICKCVKCGFETKEKNKLCPICNNLMEIIPGNITEFNPTLPDKIDNTNHNQVEMGYYCFKCRSKKKTKVCIDCNNVCSLYVEVNQKRAIINRVKHLTDIFNEKEIDIICNELNDQEKVYIYHHYESAYRFFYKKDTTKAVACFIFAAFFYYVLLDMAFNMNESQYVFMSYFFNAIGNWLFLVLSTLGIWYLFDATNVEFKHIPTKIAIIIGIPNLIQLGFSLANSSNIKEMLISGLIAMLISIIITIIYFMWERKHEK